MTAMTAERWRRVTEVLNTALEQQPGNRESYLEQACGGDAELHAEVESLLAAHSESGPLDALAEEIVSPLLSRLGSPSLRHGGTISHHRILDTLGTGGMGVVYRAVDTRLDRPVALKFLPPHLGLDPSAKQRFLVEAQAAAGLEHPNICTIYEVGETEDGELFIAMPLYEGETLRERIGRGPLPVEEAVDLALQTVRGLAKAHGQGIVHRDIKPANLIVTPDGVIKIVDFGIAKLADVCLTRPGGKLGTVAYMSPEQASGEALDHRTDLWSLGVVLYEMLAGARPYRGEHETVVLHAILHTDPVPLASHRPDLPVALERLVARALARRPEDRYTDARELARELGRVCGAAPDPSPAGVLAGGERRQATVVVSCLAGYAELMEALPPDEVGQVIGRIRSVAEEVAGRHGGVLNRFTGEEMVLLFGIPVTHEDDCARAMRAALELHARVREVNGQPEANGAGMVRLHSGIDTGQVAAHSGEGGDPQYRITGTAALIAARLATRATADEVWITPECQRLAGPFFQTEERDAVTLRERVRPLVPRRVIGESGHQTRLEAADPAGLTAFTGREQELFALQHCLDLAIGGEGQFVTVIGEAGMGKSRLLYEFRQQLDGHGFSLLRGRCQSYGSNRAYLPFIETLRDGLLLGDGDSSRVRVPEMVARIRKIGPDLEEFIPLYLHLLSIPSDEFPVPKHLQGDPFRLAMQEALAAIFTLSTRQHPAVLLLEDWHWVDDASHTVLKQMAEMIPGYPLLIVVTCRPGSITDWGNPAHHTQLSLPPLKAASSVEILRSVLRADHFPAELSARIHERTGGNPFFLEEICHTLREEGTLAVAGGQVVLAGSLETLELPDSIQAVIRARVDRLDPETRETLRLASVVGREFTRIILERTLPDGGALPQALDSLKAAGLIQQTRVVPDTAYRFKHVLTQEVAYSSLLDHQRRELHGRVGEALEQLDESHVEEHADRLAYHFSRAGEWRNAVHYGMRSAERANLLAEFVEALEILERVQSWLLKLPEGPKRQATLVEILLRQERLCETLGLRGRQQQAIDELIGLLEPAGDQAKLAETYVRQGDLYTLLREFNVAEEALGKSLRVFRQLGDPLGERNTLRSLGLLRWHQGRNAEALVPIEQALAISREQGDLETIVGDLANLGIVLKGMGEYERARAHLDEALDLTESARADRPDVLNQGHLLFKVSYILTHLANIHREQGDAERALEYLQRARQQAIAKRMPIQLSYHNTAIAHIYLQQGKVEESLEQYREAVELTRKAGYAPGLAQSLRFLGDLLLGLDRYDEALPHLREAADIFAQLRDAETEALMWSKIATGHDRKGNDPEAAAAWGKTRTLRKQTDDHAGELEALEGIARVTRRRIADPSEAVGYYRQALELAEKLGDRAAEGRLRNTMGIIEWSRGAYEAALAHYEHALEIYLEAGNDADAGLMLNSLGVTLKALGRREEARARLEEAIVLHRRSANPRLEGHALAALGDLWQEAGDSDRAVDCYQRSLAIRRETGDRTGEGWMLLALARAQLANGSPARAQGRAAEAAAIAIECSDAELAAACERLEQP